MSRSFVGTGSLAAVVLLALFSLTSPVSATDLKGRIRYAKATPTRSVRHPGFWGVPNSLVPIAAPLVDPRRSLIIALEGQGLKAEEGVLEVTLQDARFDPPVVAARPNQKIKFINRDGVLHLLEPLSGKFMSPRSINPGRSHTMSLPRPGLYLLRCSEVPHMRLQVAVFPVPRLVNPHKDGSYEFSGLPAGTYKLRVWEDGKWIHERALTLKGKRMNVDVALSAKIQGHK